ncbi:MAG: hypothetical protein ACI91O_000272 [Candidatus Poriferisodalaceae bacterium]
MSLLGAHQLVGWIFVVANAIAGCWALAATRWSELERRELWWFTAAAQVVATPQAILGVLLMTTQDRTPPDMHVFYGFLTMMVVGILYSYRQQLSHQMLALYGFGGLFLMGLGIRAMLLGTT